MRAAEHTSLKKTCLFEGVTSQWRYERERKREREEKEEKSGREVTGKQREKKVTE